MHVTWRLLLSSMTPPGEECATCSSVVCDVVGIRVAPAKAALML